jgi:hypothetical protein
LALGIHLYFNFPEGLSINNGFYQLNSTGFHNFNFHLISIVGKLEKQLHGVCARADDLQAKIVEPDTSHFPIFSTKFSVDEIEKLFFS